MNVIRVVAGAISKRPIVCTAFVATVCAVAFLLPAGHARSADPAVVEAALNYGMQVS